MRRSNSSACMAQQQESDAHRTNTTSLSATIALACPSCWLWGQSGRKAQACWPSPAVSGTESASELIVLSCACEQRGAAEGGGGHLGAARSGRSAAHVKEELLGQVPLPAALQSADQAAARHHVRFHPALLHVRKNLRQVPAVRSLRVAHRSAVILFCVQMPS